MKITNKVCGIILAVGVIAGMSHAIGHRYVDTRLSRGIVGDEILPLTPPIPYLGGRSPGEQIGTTTYDYQANGSWGMRLALDDSNQIHVDWMYCGGAYPGNPRYIKWNFRFPGGFWYGDAAASTSISGYTQLDITRDADVSMQRSVIAYHYDAGSGLFGWVDIDGGNGWGSWPNDPKSPEDADNIWPYIAVCSNNSNIVMATQRTPLPGDHILHLYLTTDTGNTWALIGEFDSCGTICQFVRASHNPGSDKVVFVWTQAIESIGTNWQLNNDVYYILSTDNGVTWGAPVNLTNYMPHSAVTDTATMAYNNVNAVFDNSDNLHIAWGVHTPYVQNDTLYTLLRHAKIFHWDEVSNSTTQINSPSINYSEPNGWWLDIYDRAGSWATACHQPQLIVDPNGDLYCFWQGQDDTTDYSAAGYFNGEFYGSRSTDNGATWSNYMNLTNTRSPGAASGACDDEDYATVYPVVVNDSIYITYNEDKDAGGFIFNEGVWTENPVRCWVLHKSSFVGVEESEVEEPHIMALALLPNPAGDVSMLRYTLAEPDVVVLKLYDATGRLVRDLEGGYKRRGVYNLNITTRELANGTYFVVLDTPAQHISQPLVIVH